MLEIGASSLRVPPQFLSHVTAPVIGNNLDCVHFQDSEIKVTECLHRVADGSNELFYVENHVNVHCSDTSVYAPINNLLVEKLDRHVVISAPEFSHESRTVQQAR